MSPTERTVFYSWQSDLPSKTNRGLIRDALERAVGQLSEAIDEPLRADSDIQGVAGARDIHHVILEKLDRCDAAVFDVTPVASNEQRKLPNPNVMLELGYGLKSPGIERVVLVLNTAYGSANELPFDIRNRPITTYSMQEAEQPAAARTLLAAKLKSGLEEILRAKKPAPSGAESVIAAIRSGSVDALLQFEEWGDELATALRTRRPEWVDQFDQRVMSSYEDALSVTSDFIRVVRTALSVLDAGDVVVRLVRILERLFGQAYRTQAEAVAGIRSEVSDFELLMARELFLAAVDCFLEARRYAGLNEFFDAEYSVDIDGRRVRGRFWSVIGRAPEFTVGRWAQREPTKWIEPLGEILKRRFEKSSTFPFRRVRAAEVVCMLRCHAKRESDWDRWWPHCLIYARDVAPPAILETARSQAGARDLMQVLGMGSDLAAFRQYWASACARAKEMTRRAFPFELDWPQPDEIGA